MTLKPWREVIVPHEDVLQGSFQESEFAADLTKVVRGIAAPDYQDPVRFFERTVITEGMGLLLQSVLRRLSGRGGDPVVQLQTAFGGGKTHTLMAVYHVARGKSPASSLLGIPTLLDRSGVPSLPTGRVAILDGNALAPSQPRHYDGIVAHTLWGELAWQIGGAEGYALVEGSDRDGTSPGKAVLAELFERFAPCIVLMDETVAYLRQFEPGRPYPGGSFDSNLSFIQALTEAAATVPTAMVLASLPESMMEVGDVQGQRALEILQKYFGRIEAVWRPVATEEAFEIVRRRLFQPVQDEVARDAVCRAFADYYLDHADQFPGETRESGYYQRLQQAYPIHPEIFARLYEDWSTLPRFQRTRGVLRLMALVIHTLWREDNRDYLIMPGSIPLHDINVRTELTKYLETQGWDAILERDVDGVKSLPRQLDDATPTLGSLQACRRAARTIFLGSAPSVSAQRVRGLGIERIRLGCAQPGQSIGHYGDALRRLADQLHYLYSGNDRYWYDTRPNLRREMEDRMQRFSGKEALYPELQFRLERMIAKGIFEGVHVFRPHSDIPDDYGLRLVVLSPDAAHRRKEESAAIQQALQYLDKRGEQPRQHKNRLIFLAPDRDALATLKDHTRRYVAWASIVHDAEQLNLDVHHAKEAKNSKAEAEERVKGSLREVYRWVLVPMQEAKSRGGLTELFWEEVTIPASASNMSEAIKRVLVENELVIEAWAPIHLANTLRQWFWKEDRSEVNALFVWQAMCNYPYLPKLVDSRVFQNTIAEGIKHRDFFAYASGKEGDRYLGLLFGKTGAIYLDQSGLLVRPDVAEEFLRREAEREKPAGPVYPGPGGDSATEAVGINDRGKPTLSPGPTPVGPKPAVMRRFHASIDIDPVRGGLQFSDIMNEVVQHFTAKMGTRVSISVDIDAESAEGFDETLQRTVRENCRTLRFKNAEFEEE